MESVAYAYLQELFGDKPAFIYGSKADGYDTKNSDMDVAVVGGKKIIKIGEIEFSSINGDVDTMIFRNIHHRSVNPFAKKIIPINKDNTVRSIEKKVKMHITNYMLKKLNAKPGDVSGKDIIQGYIVESSNLNPIYRPKAIKFLRSKESLKAVADEYDAILEGNNFPFPAKYRKYTHIDAASKLLVMALNAYSKNPANAFCNTKKNLTQYAKSIRVKPEDLL
jgi:hypothetical protein